MTTTIDNNTMTNNTMTEETTMTPTQTPRYIRDPKFFDADALVERAMSNITSASVSSIASSYQSVILNVHGWTAEIKSKKASEDAAFANNAAAEVIKSTVSILNNSAELKDINNYGQKIRQKSAKLTLPSVEGERILRHNRIQEHIDALTEMERVYRAKAHDFAYITYPSIIKEGQKAMGDLAQTITYPTPDEVYSKFRLTVRRQPLSAEANFHSQLEAQAREELEDMFRDSLSYVIRNAMRESWESLYTIIYSMVNSLTDHEGDEVTGESKKKKLYESTLFNHPKAYIEKLEQYNVANDPELAARAQELKQILSGMHLADLKEFPDARRDAKQDLEDLLSKFDL
jgi:hypothetical protein